MENKSSVSSLPPNYVTIKDLRERWLNRQLEQKQQNQNEQPETGKEKFEKQGLQAESRSPSQSLHTECVSQGEAGRAQGGRGVDKPGRTPWEPWVRFSGPIGRGGDRKPASGRWWSSKERRGSTGVEANRVGGAANCCEEEVCGDSDSSMGHRPVSESQSLLMENVVEAASVDVSTLLESVDGKNARSMEGVKDESRSSNINVVEQTGIEMATNARQMPRKETPGRRASPGKGVQDKSRLQSNSLHVDKMAEMGALNKTAVMENGEVVEGDGQALLEGAAGEGVLLKMGWRRSSRRKNKSKVVENEVAAATGHAEDLLEGADGKNASLREGVRAESMSKNKNMVQENQVEVAEVSSSEVLKGENEIRNRIIFVEDGLKVAGSRDLELPEGVARESDIAKSKNGKKKNRNGKNKKDAYVKSTITDVEAALTVGDVICVNLAGSRELELPERVARENNIAKSKNSKKNNQHGKNKEYVYVKRTITNVEATPGVGDVICVNLAHEMDGQIHNMSTENNDRREPGHHSVRMDHSGYRRGFAKKFDGRREMSNQRGGKMVWVKKDETATDGQI